MSVVQKVFYTCLIVLIGYFPMEDAAAPRTEAPFDVTIEPYHAAAIQIGAVQTQDAPNFQEIRHTPDRKAAFFDFMLPLIHEANFEVAKERRWLGSLAMQLLQGTALSEQQKQHVAKTEKRYRLKNHDLADAERVGQLLKRVDVVPAALVIAQAAKESGWGTSRFATVANNYFGIWCFYRGCGVTPLRRTDGLNHEVATFATVRQSVRYYVRTLNSHPAYDGFRQLRSEKRIANKPMVGDELAARLLRYSERGQAYVDEIQSMIQYNDLARFNQPYRPTHDFGA